MDLCGFMWIYVDLWASLIFWGVLDVPKLMTNLSPPDVVPP